MNKLVIAFSIAALSAAGAQASDLAVRPYTKALPMAVAYDWSGFYIGSNDGAAWSHNCWDANPFIIPLFGVPINWGGPEGCHTASGVTAGGQAGYRWQREAWMFGLEAQGDWANLTGASPSPLIIFAGTANQTKIDAIGLFTGQVGYAWNNFLLYAKGGAAVTHDRYEGILTAPLAPLSTGFTSDRGSETRWGGVAGIGGEYALTRNLSLALEYDHLFMGARDVALTYNPPFIPAVSHIEHISQDVDMLTARVNYRFGDPGAAGTQASDLMARPYIKAPPFAVAYDWSGFYLGGNTGGAWSHNCSDANPFTVAFLGVPTTFGGPEGCHTASGATAGGQLGYRWQHAAWMFGLEAQGNWAGLTGSNPSQLAVFAGTADQAKTDAIGLFTGQVGYAWNNFLLYVKDGAAVTHDRYQGVPTAPLGPLAIGLIPDSGRETRWGEVIGIGGEYALTRNWSLALEYDHLFMGARDVALTHDPAVAAANHSEHISQDIDMVTARVNYRFGDFSAAGAQASDLAARSYTKAPAMAAGYNWSGLYVGGNNGGAWSHNCWDANLIVAPEGCHTAGGATAGGQAGYRWQRAAWVFGLEAQGNWADLKSSNPSQLAAFAGTANQTKVDAIGLFTGQIGYAWGNFLLYVKDGAAVTHDRYEGILTTLLGPLPAGSISDRGSETRWGEVVGIGGEYALTQNLSLALEYDHLFMGARDVALIYDPAFAAMNHSEHISQDIDMVTARVNYRFDGLAGAQASDLAARPYTKAPPMAVVYDWSGFYIGGNDGGAWSHNCWDVNPLIIPLFGVPINWGGPEGCHTARGVTAGGQAGYRWQRAAWMFGLEAQGDWANLAGANLSPLIIFAGTANQTRIDAVGLFTGQVGYAWNKFLLYAKGGAAVTHDSYEGILTAALSPVLPIGFVSDRGSETRWGGVAGIGTEYALPENLSVALEYDHLFMGARDIALTYGPAFIAAVNHNEHISQDIDMLTARVNYRFGGPVVAKY